MPLYAIGDIQGCFETLQRLLKRLAFNPAEDRLWLVGDLVNRGPRSLETLRWARDQGDRVTAVLGNHDLHLLARAAEVVGPKKKDTLEKILEAPDREELLDWLKKRPLVYREGKYLLVHGGLHPRWSGAQAELLAREVEKEIQGPSSKEFLAAMFGKVPLQWEESLKGLDRLEAIVTYLTKIRACTPEGILSLDYKGPPAGIPQGYLPWYEVPHRQSRDSTIIFGHWSALGLLLEEGLAALDTGCVWGSYLTAVRLDDWKVFQEPFAD